MKDYALEFWVCEMIICLVRWRSLNDAASGILKDAIIIPVCSHCEVRC